VRFLRTTISCVAVLFFAPLSQAHPHAVGLTFPLLVKWTAALDAVPIFPPAYDSRHAYIALKNDHLLAVALESGKPAWSVECPTTSAPAAGDSLAFVGGNGFVQAHAQQDGVTVWRTEIEGTVNVLYWDTGWLIATTDKGVLFAMRAADGKVLWQRNLDAPLQSLPAPAGDRMYLSLKSGALLALTLETGDPIWTVMLPKPGNGILAVGDRIYIGSQDDRFYCLSAKNGDTVWLWKTGADVVGTAAIDSKHVYFVSLDNVLRALDRNSGSVRWQKSLPMRPSGGPLLTGWTLLVAGAAAELHAFSSEFNGNELVPPYVWLSPQNLEVQLAGPPHLHEDGVILVTRGGEIRSLVSSPSPSGP